MYDDVLSNVCGAGRLTLFGKKCTKLNTQSFITNPGWKDIKPPNSPAKTFKVSIYRFFFFFKNFNTVPLNEI